MQTVSAVRRRERAVAVFLLLVFVLVGLLWHAPWKQDEGYGMDIVYHILRTGHVVVPRLGGEPFMEKPPLFFILAAGLARLFHPLLSLADGARLAAGASTAVTLGFTGLIGAALGGRRIGVAAMLLLAGCLGLLPYAHAIMVDNAELAGYTMGLYGLLSARDRPAAGGAWLGTGAGIAFLAKGLLAPGCLGLTALLLPLLGRAWRTRAYALALALAAALALPWLVIWPTALYLRSPVFFRAWLWDNNFGRYLGFAGLGPPNAHAYYLVNLLWFAFPAWPLALFAAWRAPKPATPPARALMVAGAVFLAVLMSAATARAAYALPVLVPLCVFAASGLERLPPSVVSASVLLSRALFGALALGLWAARVAMLVRGRPPAWRRSCPS